MLRVHQPTGRCGLWIQLIWEWDNYAAATTLERILPHGMLEVSWNMSHGHRLCGAQDQPSQRPTSGATVIGPRDGPYWVDTPPGSRLFGVVFQPGAGARVLQTSAMELHGGFFAMSDFAVGHQLESQVSAASTFAARCAAVCDALVPDDCTAPATSETRLLTSAWSTAEGRTRSVQSLRDTLGLSAPTLVARLKDQLGLRPAQLRQLLMFRHAVETLANHASHPLAQTALELGYCDQAHLCRAFSRHAGLSPRQFAPTCAEHPFNLAEHASP